MLLTCQSEDFDRSIGCVQNTKYLVWPQQRPFALGSQYKTNYYCAYQYFRVQTKQIKIIRNIENSLIIFFLLTVLIIISLYRSSYPHLPFQMILNPLNNRKPVSFELYKQKKDKQPDHLFNLIAKSRKEKQNSEVAQNLELDFKVKDAIRRHMIEKRVNNILTCSATVTKSNLLVSQPVKCVQKPWVPPLEKQLIEKKFSQQQLLIEAKKKQEKSQNREKITKLLKVINLNKKMRYFGDYLSSQFDGQERKTFSICHIPKTKESKLSFLQSKYKRIIAKKKPKLFILNAPLQQQKYFFNPLQTDEYFSTIIKAHDKQLMRILISVLSQQDHFTLTSFTKFYDIFVWQTAARSDLTKFAAKILMGDKEELPILKISNRIDQICGKIDLEELHNNTDNFSEIMKKLLFGEEFVLALKNEYFLTRKALTESLERNEECISIFINVFYM